MDEKQFTAVISKIGELPADFHISGMMPVSVLSAIYQICGSNIQFSMETGSGLSTIVFSHISKNHLVFAKDDGNSISAVRNSELFNHQNVEFVEGATQKTLPRYNFTHEFDVILIDGPHGYPFPDMEYYYAYPHIKAGGILIIDDITIPTIRNLFNFLNKDEMFELIDVLGDNTAFFRRTSKPLFDPIGDGWWLQKYNKLKDNAESTGVDQRNEALDQSRQRVFKLEGELNTIYSSRGWQLILKANKIISRLLPAWIIKRIFKK